MTMWESFHCPPIAFVLLVIFALIYRTHLRSSQESTTPPPSTLPEKKGELEEHGFLVSVRARYWDDDGPSEEW